MIRMPEPNPPATEQRPTKRRLFYLIVLACSALYLWTGYQICVDKAQLFRNEMGLTETVARVETIVSDRNDMGQIGGTVYYERVITFWARILSGERKGEQVKVVQTIDNLTGNGQLPVSEGDKLFIFQTGSPQEENWEAGEFYRSDAILLLAGLFLLGLLLFGRRKGLMTILSLVLTCLAIFIVFVPAILAGYNAYAVSVITCLFIIAMTLSLVSGLSKKSLAAALGCAGGVAVAGILSVVMDKLMKLTGYLNDETMYVSLLNEANPIDLKGIVFAAIVIGAMGATMDVAMDISSSLFEIHRKVPDISYSHLVQSGFTIGRDIMGTMANTLILAYIGSSLTTVLLYATVMLLFQHRWLAANTTGVMRYLPMAYAVVAVIIVALVLLCVSPLVQNLARWLLGFLPKTEKWQQRRATRTSATRTSASRKPNSPQTKNTDRTDFKRTRSVGAFFSSS